MFPLLGQDHPHATGQVHGQSRATAQADQTQGTKKPHEMVARAGSQLHNKQNVHAVMTEFLQPLQVLSHLEMPGILVQLCHIQRT